MGSLVDICLDVWTEFMLKPRKKQRLKGAGYSSSDMKILSITTLRKKR